ncbi:hypothetical protein ACSFL6_001329 [Escherichia coli]
MRQQGDKAIVLTLCEAGLLVGLLVELLLYCYSNTHHTQGKRAKYQEITVAPVVARALFGWIKANSGSGALFTYIHRYG